MLTHYMRQKSRWFWAILVSLSLLHFAIAMLAARTKSVTYDEPLHTVGGWTVNQFGDYRLEPENPILFDRYVGLFSRPDELPLTQNSRLWSWIIPQASSTFEILYNYVYCPPADIDDMVERRRPRFALIGGVIVFGAGWLTRSMARSILPAVRTAPEMGALVTASLLALNPTLLGHSPLVKNDVMIALAMLWVASGLWIVLQRVTPRSLIWLALGVALAPLFKYSGVFIGPMVAMVLLIRALSTMPWACFARPLDNRKSRVIASILVSFSIAFVCYIVTWAAYGFRYTASADGTPLNFQWLVDLNVQRELTREVGTAPPPEVLRSYPPSGITKFLLSVNDLRLIPEGMTYGMLHVQTLAYFRPYYFFGSVSRTPSLLYFPAALALKEPLANLVLIVGAAVSVWKFRRPTSPTMLLAGLALLPGFLYFLLAILGPMAIGLRHLLPFYPPLFIAIGLGAAMAWKLRLWIQVVLGALVALSATESLFRAPNFISFFNVLAGGPYSRSKMFADANIDWGQDLKAMIRWKQSNPDERLYLSYFGTINPKWYDFDFQPLFAPTDDPANPYRLPDESGVAAISVMNLNGMNPTVPREHLELFRGREPYDVVGGSIYLFRWPLVESADGE